MSTFAAHSHTASMNRRAFLMTAGVAGMTAVTSGAYAVQDDAGWDEVAEVVVVGSGAAGTATAMAAIEAGADVLVVEKGATLGGISSACVQFCAYDSKLHTPQPYADVTDSADAMFEAAMEVSGGTADPVFLRKLCDESAGVIDWMVDHGCSFKEALRPSDGRQGQGKYITATPGELISKIMPTVQEQARVLTECALTRVVRDPEIGRVTGVVCDTPNGELRIQATKGVVICSGPWPDDPVLGARHLPPMGEVPAQTAQAMAAKGMPYGPYTGEAVRAAQAIGAAVRHMEYIMPDPYYAPPAAMEQGIAAFGVSRSVDLMLLGPDGKRFTNEGQQRGAIARDIMAQEGCLCYPITDGHVIPGQMQMGGSQEVMDQWVANGFAACGNTFEELAAQMEELFGTPADAVLQSLAAYNEACAAGEDPAFGKDPHYLTALDQPPFYAGPVATCRYLYTHGGLETTIDAQVLDVDGQVIPGLYAAGMCTGGHLGADTISGNWQVDCVVFGRIAGEHAALLG